jgi:hypothetical protein
MRTAAGCQMLEIENTLVCSITAVTPSRKRSYYIRIGELTAVIFAAIHVTPAKIARINKM